ncbi:DoxX family membrane protein [Flagellimonas sp. HMM57]|uniref:DoxX family protein n=1 Tax=unclassified Flagellimonas TaxID=2644544 RepID=UPI0013D35163|nr:MULTISPECIES: DoxX family membrane protein [unclassified Flagellimonas]UII76553.1 DoxX family membrane protein [Flagellimonas sp. HMM57]
MVDSIKDRNVNISIVLLRVFIGWHFLYEGVIKLFNPEWTSFGYLASAQGPLKPFFSLLISPSVIGWVDVLNMAALIIVGVAFTLGVFEKKGAIVAIGLLALYYLAHPPFPWLDQLNTEGNYWFVNKNLIELIACILIYNFPTGHYFGLNYFIKRKPIKT